MRDSKLERKICIKTEKAKSLRASPEKKDINIRNKPGRAHKKFESKRLFQQCNLTMVGI